MCVPLDGAAEWQEREDIDPTTPEFVALLLSSRSALRLAALLPEEVR